MTIEQKRRKLFEDALHRDWDPSLVFLERSGDGYVFGDIDSAWWAFNAALDAVVIDIRRDYFPGSDNMGAIVLDKNYSRFAFLRIIEDTGLGLKVKV